jgi:dipeptidyl aminopeptidase/acylaminoacyl peptidase
MTQQRAPYGTWRSPVTPEMLTAHGLAFAELSVDGGAAYWCERRPNDGGRTALVRWTRAEGARDVSPPGADVGSRVHEYGGGSYLAADGRVVYSERGDGAVRRVDADGSVLTVAAVPGCRFADFALDRARDRLYAVREDHRHRPPTEPANAIVALALDAPPETNDGVALFDGSDFVANPRANAAGTHLAWIAWDHPNMPWDATRLYVAAFDERGGLEAPQIVAGAGGDESITALAWARDGTLYFVSDRSDWWNLYAWRDGTATSACAVDAEIGPAPWSLAPRAFAVAPDGDVVCAFVRDGSIRAARCTPAGLEPLAFGPIRETPQPLGVGAVYLATPVDAPAEIRLAASLDDAAYETLRAAGPRVLDAADVSVGEALVVPTGDGETMHAFYYAPKNARFAGPEGERPPLVVVSHGGPTSMNTHAFSLGVQWFTSRGFAVADVNYRGSTGFGRAYRRRLDGMWGVVDVADCEAVARALAARGLVDPARIAIRGGSASGFTALAALAHSRTFGAATSLYGVMDLELLARETHKFEARYLDRLIGPLPLARATYRARSPLANVERIASPVLLFQGAEDRVVPPNQAEAMAAALRARGVRVEHVVFAGEGHGFRKAETIRSVLERELAFYGETFGFLPATS